MQLTHKHYNPTLTHREIILVCDAVTSPANQGGLFRLADAFGVKEIVFYDALIDLTSARLRKTARSTQDKVRFRESENIYEEIQLLKAKNFDIIALEITNDSIPIQELNGLSSKIALIVGAESQGIQAEILLRATKITHIPMYGENSSMNVAQAAAIALYAITNS